MTVDEKAKEFAAKFLDDIKEIIVDAYIEGYCEGKYDAEEKRDENEDEDDSDFIDLGLPSGTLWREDFLSDEDCENMRLAYNEARNFSLPTEEQCRELMSKCILVREKNGITFRGKDNGER